jgi:hypothetical protein
MQLFEQKIKQAGGDPEKEFFILDSNSILKLA